MKTYVRNKKTLKSDEIFVFGSNTQGRHGKGAALDAKKLFGAVNGQARGRQGQCFAIVTKDLTKDTHPSRTDKQIREEILSLYSYAAQHKDLKFFVAYNGKSKLLNGNTVEHMASLFDNFRNLSIPDNIYFQKDFAMLIHEARTSSLF